MNGLARFPIRPLAKYHRRMTESESAADFQPTATWHAIQVRAKLLRATRAFFDERGFLEVETPILSADVVVDRHLDPFATTLAEDARFPDHGRRLWLQTSPEFGMKRLLVAGGKAIYQITRAFRNGERGTLHNPEFTILEWYRCGDSYEVGRKLLGELSEALLSLGPAQEISYADAFLQFVGCHPHTALIDDLVDIARRKHIFVPKSLDLNDRDGWLELLLGELVEPFLGLKQPTILFDYPASQSALAQVRDEQPPVAERFELYVRGVELANGYHELLDPAVLRVRNRRNNQQRQADGKPMLPEESRLLAAMDYGLPSCTGVALGFDRLVMVALGANSLSEVVAFPIDRA